MGEVFSHSKLSLYEQCPEAYKVKYIEKTFPELPKSIHLFLGDVVHQSLEFLHERVRQGAVPELDDVIRVFADTWHRDYTLDIRVKQGETIEMYFQKGLRFIIDYYQSNFPFSDNTIEIEKKIVFPLNEKYWIQGYIDRIVKKGEEEYEVHDYKTNERMKKQEEVDADRQLAFYHLGLQKLFGENIQVKLIWHFLAHNQKVFSFRSKEQLEKLKAETIALIEKINNTAEWSACGKPWCDWCAFKNSPMYRAAGVEAKREGGGGIGGGGSGAKERGEGGSGFGGKESRKFFTLNRALSEWMI